MRIFNDFEEARNEIRRDLAEMGIQVKPKTYQNKDISEDESMNTRELQNYSYTIINSDPNDIEIPNVAWALAEWEERRTGIEGEPVNPGEAWKWRSQVWEEFLVREQFDYSYPERLWQNGFNPIGNIISRIKQDPGSRQLWCSIWDQSDNLVIGGKARVPCSLGYNFQVRNDQVNIHYVMRSCDFATHFSNDVFFACKLLDYVSEKTGYLRGTVTQTIFSMHIYERDVKDVF